MALIATFTLSSQIGSFKRLKGIGVFGSGTLNKHEYVNKNTPLKDTMYRIEDYYPQTHISKEFLNWGAGLFVEIGIKKFRWQSEIEYINKGAKEMPLVNPFTGERSGTYANNKLTYIQWNNFLKFYFPLTYSTQWYLMPGIRVEYLFKSSTPVFSDYAGGFPKFWFSGDVGIGFEFPITEKIHGFIEGHWNPDIISHKQEVTKIRARTFELRGGLVLRPRKRRIDDCNAPIYKGPAY